MVNLTLAVGGLWGSIINWFMSFIPNFGLTIIVITVLIKLVTTPLEVYQKISSKKNAEKQAILQPKLEKLQKQYGKNKEMLNQKTMELYKKENYNVMGSCLTMLITFVLTIVIFITLFNSINAISQNNIKNEYSELQAEYIATYKESLAREGEITLTSDMTVKDVLDLLATNTNLDTIKATASAEASDKTSKLYGKIKEDFLWIQNVYRPDTWVSVFPDAKEFISISNTKFKDYNAENPYTDIFGQTYTTNESAKTAFINDFNLVTSDIKEDFGGWNGWLILVILAAGITVVSQVVATASTKPKKQYDKKGNEITPNMPNTKIMLFLLPALMVVFAIQYSSAFALHIVINSLMSTLIGFITTVIMNKIEKRKAKKEQNV